MKNYKMQVTWAKIAGVSKTHTLEARIFHITCVFTILLFFCSIFFNYLIGLYALSLMLIPAVGAACVVYYLSRFKYKHSLSVAIFCAAGNLLFIVFFLNNSGINGPCLVIYLLFFFLVMSIVPARQRLFWMSINICIALLLIAFQFYYPASVPLKYRNDTSRYLDAGYVYLFTLVIVYLILKNIIDDYNKARSLAEKRSDLLHQANESKNKLFSIVAHDLRAPLNSIQNFLEVSLEVDIDEEEKRVINSSLLKETKYTRQMLINLLSWSKTQMEGMSVNLIRLRLEETLEPTLLLQASIAHEKGILLSNAIEKNIQVIADSDMLELVIRNLVSNAIKFTPAGGRIDISSEIHRHECWIKVQDSGVGIAKTNYENIFSLHAESTYGTNNEKGVGLGLVLCREFITMQKGKIWVESTLNVGTTFYVSLELAAHAELFPVHLN